MIDENILLQAVAARELGLLDKISNSGFENLTTQEKAKISGLINKREKERLSNLFWNFKKLYHFLQIYVTI